LVNFLVMTGFEVQNCGMMRGFRMAVLAVAAMVSGYPAHSLEVVDLNRATLTELMQVKGMTPTWAARIVRFRPYRTKQDLVQEGVVTPEVYQRIRNGIVAHRGITEAEHR
jgi:hypothetical protein